MDWFFDSSALVKRKICDKMLVVMSVTEVLNEIDKLSPVEKRRVADALLCDGDQYPDASVEERQAALHRQMLAEGMIRSIPTRQERPPHLRDFKRLEIEGKPVSETIIEERR